MFLNKPVVDVQNSALPMVDVVPEE